jgi:alanyl-tRNA synthetase
MTSTQIRQSFLDFFKSKQHTLVSSSSLLPDSPNLLFTNAGMNQFVPIFLAEQKCPYTPGRAADTQKCIRAGGKHNDLEDVGLDTYHHTFFEMLGNWSFGDYFKQEAIEWAWELVTAVWKFPQERLYATVYKPAEGDPSEFDQEAYDHWARLFTAAGLDPKVHIVNGNKKDNFWMMGETGPCGPCSELHVDLTPDGDTKGRLVNAGDSRCIEIWNLVFIQFNANPDGTFSPLPARHVDTGMGFERVTSILQCTRGFNNFQGIISNYETDIFRPIFDKLEMLSGRKYASTLPRPDASGAIVPATEQEKVDVAFRVIADHIRTLSFAIADGIQPGNTDRNYVLRRILRRAVRYGRTLGFHQPFLHLLVEVLAETMGGVFPEIHKRRQQVQDVIRREEESFNKTLDGGLRIFEDMLRIMAGATKVFETLQSRMEMVTRAEYHPELGADHEAVAALYHAAKMVADFTTTIDRQLWEKMLEARDESRAVMEGTAAFIEALDSLRAAGVAKPVIKDVLNELHAFRHALLRFLGMAQRMKGKFGGPAAFVLYDTYGFPLDLTQLMAREQGLTVDVEVFERLMEEQRERARAAQKKQVIEVSELGDHEPTRFTGFEALSAEATVQSLVEVKGQTAVIVGQSPFYAEMGGQVGDTGEIVQGDHSWRVRNTQKAGGAWLHFLGDSNVAQASRLPDQREPAGTAGLPSPGATVTLSVDRARRSAIQRHHTVTHILHWALHEVASREASQKGSFVGPDKLTFDFNHGPLTPQQVSDIEKLVNERILENAGVSWAEVPYADVKSRSEVMQFFGDKYGDTVRVVQIGGRPGQLDGYSMELCGGTHTLATGEIGLFRIVGESAIAAGVRRIEAVAGLESYRQTQGETQMIRKIAGKVNTPVTDLEKKIEALLEQQKVLEKELKAARQRESSNAASNLKAHARVINGIPTIIHNVGEVDGEFLQGVADGLKGIFQGVIVLGGCANGAVSLVAAVTPDYTSRVQAGNIIKQIAPIVGGKGGGRPDNARGGGKDADKLGEALAKAKSLLE